MRGLPTLCGTWQAGSPSPNPGTESTCHLDNTSLEDPAMVSSASGDADSASMPATISCPGDGQRRAVSPMTTWHTSGQDSNMKNLSEQATELVLKSWRPMMNKSYHLLFGRWSHWCTEQSMGPLFGPVSEIVNFLANIHEEGLQYNS